MNEGLAGFILGAMIMTVIMGMIIGLNYIHKNEIVTHQNCAYYHPITGNLTWLDSNESH